MNDKLRIESLEASIREAYEIYAGSESFIAETAPEAYLQRIISQMVGVLSAALKLDSGVVK